jgi:hypothetical protein
MKYISIDLETTGLDPNNHQVLEIGAIIEDTNNIKSFEDSPKFSCIVYQPTIIGAPYALAMNARILGIIGTYQEFLKGIEKDVYRKLHNILHPNEVGLYFRRWLDENDIKEMRINCAGKNFGSFDKLFLNNLPHMNEYVGFRSRIADPAILYVDWENDLTLPNLNDCKKRCGIIDTEVSHKAIEDAWDVILCLRPAYTKIEK